jgi:serine protease Do
MSKGQMRQRVWIFVLSGIVIGLLIGAGLHWTAQTSAQTAPPAAIASPAPASQNDPGENNIAQQLSDVFAKVAEIANPSVVTIFTETTIKAQSQSDGSSPFDQFFGGDFFKKFFQMPNQGNYTQEGLGSGVIVDANGIILTNNHVVKGADNIKVSLMDGREFVAKVKGTDPQTDLAVITIEAKNLPPIKLGDSGKVRVGDWVLAIGSPLNPELQHTVTAGIISAKGRSGVGLSQYEDYIQTDAAINPGNSGGALVNMQGELIAINSAIATQTGGNQGIGFAIPVDLAKSVMQDIIKTGKVVRGWLGVYIQDVNPQIANALKLATPQGVIVTKIQANSPAAKANLKEEDVIVKFNGKSVDNAGELSAWVASTSPGTEVTLTIIRNGKSQDINIKLGELNPQTQKSAQNEATFDDIGLELVNITPAIAQKLQLSPNQQGVVVAGIDPQGISAEAGIQVGDVIVKLNREDVKSVQDFSKIYGAVKPDENLLFYVRRGEGNLFIAFSKPEK